MDGNMYLVFGKFNTFTVIPITITSISAFFTFDILNQEKVNNGTLRKDQKTVRMFEQAF